MEVSRKFSSQANIDMILVKSENFRAITCDKSSKF